MGIIDSIKTSVAKSGSNKEKILYVKDYIKQKKIVIIIAKYKKGDTIEEIKKQIET